VRVNDSTNGLANGSATAVQGVLTYLMAGQARPRNYADDPPPGEPQSTAQYEERTVAIRSLRQEPGRFSVDREGFQFATAPSSFRSFADRDAIEEGYYAEAERVVAELTGASDVLVFDHTVRHRGIRPTPCARDPRGCKSRAPQQAFCGHQRVAPDPRAAPGLAARGE
jgi:hypothetical protein